MNVRNHIKELRLAAKLSQQELADRCQVSRQTINAIENNKYDPTLQNVRARKPTPLEVG
ncbi:MULTISPECIES: helix-turn-helix transcriptional regulator [Exiguobacterium]|uniref:Helix-turn-helix domain-containing protein n=1 Tax=Exiguobacterium acetylicum TaxID=41170 RepID=A0ABX8GDI7_EXIAC|nr:MULTISPECIES: helix-turn-helix domain-containing protein [Exiguobacterium]MDT0173825.1 helix-turn-helix domain-containing protein [Exiguobacterium sp. BRG2]QWB31374.1 helix-turn-helix domain-containing protein [Exiguobacterium acetylicum]